MDGNNVLLTAAFLLLGILDRASEDQSSCERNAVLSD